MPISTIIVEDEPEAVCVLQSMCNESPHGVQVLDICSSPKEALASIRLHKPDFLLLDVELTGGVGFDVLDAFDDPEFRTVFVSAFDQYALKAIKYHALDYLIKPIDVDEFNQIMHKIADQSNNNFRNDIRRVREYLEKDGDQKIGVPTSSGTHYYRLDEIIKLESDGSYTILFLKSGERLVVCKYLKEFERLLSGKSFSRVHRKFLVNMSWVRGLNRDDGGYLILKNGDRVPVARSAKEHIEKMLKNDALRL